MGTRRNGLGGSLTQEEKSSIVRQAVALQRSLEWLSHMAKLQKYMEQDKRYAKYVINAAEDLGFKNMPGSRLLNRRITSEDFKMYRNCSNAIARLINQAFQIINHHDRAFEILPEVLVAVRNDGKGIEWNEDAPDQLKAVTENIRSTFSLDKEDFPTENHFNKDSNLVSTLMVSENPYEEDSMLQVFCKMAMDQYGLKRFVFYPGFKKYISSPPVTVMKKKSLFGPKEETVLVGGDGKAINIGDYKSLITPFQKKNVIIVSK